jgi:hypothetical protein
MSKYALVDQNCKLMIQLEKILVWGSVEETRRIKMSRILSKLNVRGKRRFAAFQNSPEWC